MDLVTGANGFIGNVLVRELLKKGRKVRALYRKTSEISSLDGLDIERSLGDILDINSLVKAFKGIKNVYHLAGIISIMPGNRNRIREVNYTGTKNVIEACKICEVNKLIYTSSIHALKEPHKDIIFDENMPFDPLNQRGEYDRSKALSSLAVLDSAGDGLEAVVLCPTGTMGPYDFGLSAITRTFLDYYRGKVKMSVVGAYDFVDVRDVAAGHIMAAEKGKSGQYYILSGERLTMDNIMEMLEKITGIKKPAIELPVRLAQSFCYLTPIYYYLANKTPRYTAYTIATLSSNSNISHSKATDELGYNPKPIRQSIEDTFKWFKDTGIIN